MKKTGILLIVAGIFVFTQACLAASVDPAKIVVPADQGRIVETYISPTPNAPLVAYVQDIHLNYEAQKAEIGILETLIRDYGFDVIFREAKTAGNKEDFKYLRETSSPEARSEAAEKLLKEGTIASQDYLDLTTDYDFTIIGVEDMALYKTETVDHIAIIGSKDDMLKLVSSLQNIASSLKPSIYSKEMQELDTKIAAYNKDEIGLVEYVKYLEGVAAANAIDIKALPNIALFSEASGLEGQIDFAAVEKERTEVSDAIEKASTDPKAKEELTKKNAQFRTGEITQSQFYTYLKDAAATAKVDTSADKNLNTYTQYITTYDKIDTTQLFRELDKLEADLKTVLAKTPEQQKLSKVDKDLAIMANFINTKLVPDEYNYLQQNKAEFDADSWVKFLKENSVKYNLTTPVPEDVSLLKKNIPLLDKFYATAFERDKAFIQNIKANLASTGKDRAIFIGGGFHTANMKGLLKDSGMSYVIIAPRVDVIKDYEKLYKEKTQSSLEYINKVVGEKTAS